MNKELLNKILPYCGHGLKAIYEDDIVDVCISSSGTRRINIERLLTKSSDGTYHYKPILFPPECLTKEIETEHGKEWPIFEAMKIGVNRKPETDSSEISGILTERYNESWELFQYLYSRHIAFNLEPDDYVSVESLESNPYVS